MSQAYDLLLGIALLRENNKQQLEDWQGILTEVNKCQVLIDKESIDEMVTVSGSTRVLDEREWLSGLMNYRGNLLPLIDLKKLIDPQLRKQPAEGRQTIILTEKYGPIGLLVDSVKGMRHFWSDEANIQTESSSLDHLMKMQINFEGQIIHMLDLKKLISIINYKI